MSWNNSGNEQKGWGPKSTPPGGSPPDLEELFKQWYKKLFGAKGPTRTGSAKPNKANSIGAGLIVVGLSALYMVSGIYIVQPAERVVITRFGKYMDIVGPGPHWFARGIEQKYVVDVQAVHTTRHGGLMLTRDENIVNVEIAVQYCIDDARAYLFNVDDPERSLKQVTDSSLRYVVGHSTLDEVLTHGRSELAAAVRTQIKETLAGYSTGLSVVEVALQPATPPEEVKSAFDDVIRAQEDEQSLMNEADAYARKVEPIAQGQSRRILEEAQAYKERVVLHATGDASRFAAVLPAYKAAPDLMRTRLYLDTMEDVLSHARLVVVDKGLNPSMMLIPLESGIARMLGEPEHIDEGAEPTTIAPSSAGEPRKGNARSAHHRTDARAVRRSEERGE